MKQIGTLIAVAALAIGPAFAGDDVTGTIKSIDPANHEVTFDDGNTYDVSSHIALEGFKPGEQVTVNAERKDGKNIASTIHEAGANEIRSGGGFSAQ